jgi:hypothetical protein
MATSTLIQRLEAGETGVSNRSQTETFLVTLTNGGGADAIVTLAKGTWMTCDDSKSGSDKVLFAKIAAGSAATANLVLGPVAESVSTSLLVPGASQTVKVEVVISGWAIASVTSGGAIVVGDALVVDATAGRADEYVNTDPYAPCGVALTVPAANLAEVLVFKKF